LNLLLRRRAQSLASHERAELRKVLRTTTAAPSPIATLRPETATWLLWAMSWRGVSTAQQLAEPPIHAPTLVVQWRTSMPGTLCFGPAAQLLRVLADCAERLYRFWARTVARRSAWDASAQYPRMARIKFTPVMLEANSAPVIDDSTRKPSFASMVCANLTTSDRFVA
jgi:hypothetical protein